eukprot:363324-Chlamydomonas_euryale.AAC.1
MVATGGLGWCCVTYDAAQSLMTYTILRPPHLTAHVSTATPHPHEPRLASPCPAQVAVADKQAAVAEKANLEKQLKQLSGSKLLMEKTLERKVWGCGRCQRCARLPMPPPSRNTAEPRPLQLAVPRLTLPSQTHLVP